MIRKFLCGAAALLALGAVAAAQNQPAGIGICTGNPPAALSVSGTTSNVQLKTCGPTVIVYNITSQEVFYTIGSASSTVATTSSNSLPGNTYVVLVVPTASPGYYFAAITATSTSTLRFVQGSGR